MKNILPKRLYALDVSRGIASLSVVLYHWQHFAFNGTIAPDDFIRENQPFYKIFRIFYERGLLGVEYFFLISGFIFFWLYQEKIIEKTESLSHFFLQRFSRLYPLHFACLLLVGSLQFYYFNLENTFFVYPENDFYHFVLNIFFASQWGLQDGHSFNGPVWSVSIEILLYFLFFLLCRARLSGLMYLFLIVILAKVFGQAYPYLFRSIQMFFLGGIIFSFIKMILGKKRSYIPWVFFLTLLSWSIVITHFYISDLTGSLQGMDRLEAFMFNNFSSYVLFPLTVSILILSEEYGARLFKKMAWIGNITYSSYLLHFPLQLILMLFVSNELIEHNFYENGISLILFMLVLIPVSFLVYNFFERPMQKYLRKEFS